MKVALLTDGVTPFVIGGMQRHSRMLAEHLARQGVLVKVFHTVFDAGRATAAREFAGIPEDAGERLSAEFIPYPDVSRMPGHYLREEAEYSRRILERYLAIGCAPDFIYAQGLTALAFLRHRDAGHALPPIGVNTHGYGMFQAAGTLRMSLQHLMLRPAFARVNRGADRVFCFSGKIREIVERRLGIPAARIVEVPNAVDESWIADSVPASAGTRRFTFIGRYERCKGVEELLGAIRRLPPEGWRLDFIGPIPERHRIEHPNVRFHGPVSGADRLMAFLDDSDCLLCPSYSEGMPTVILEAMARGNAIIATDVGATRELVRPGNGILLNWPTAEGIAEAMRTITGMDAAGLGRLKATSLERVRAYTWHEVARRHIAAMRA